MKKHHLPPRSNPPVVVSAALLFALSLVVSRAAGDKVYSGPQPGERTTPFKVLEIQGDNAGRERDPIVEYDGAATTLVFVHGLERSIAPLLSVVDEYGIERRDQLKTEFVFLSGDRLGSQQQLPMVRRSLRLQSPASLSVDGAEGPGNYGLNKECLMTVVVAKDNQVTANFALVQPGIADAPDILAAMAKVSGDDEPPTAEALLSRRRPADARMAPAERMERRRAAAATGNELPGAAPTDEKLIGLLRQFIQRTNDDATVDRVLRETTEYVRDNEELTRQAIDGWTRVLHLNYGTPYALEAGEAWLKKLKP
ncbi:MAG TPA: hypothetical protein VMS21_01520 [Methylomirabilota bacterium]|nr:hypothetical protein [Methylomirabilota bacterium]